MLNANLFPEINHGHINLLNVVNHLGHTEKNIN